mgnify:FL=1
MVDIQRWDELDLEKVTEMVSRKIVTGDSLTLAQVYLKRGAHVPLHVHDEEQMVYVLKGRVRWLVAGQEMVVIQGEVLRVQTGVMHQAEAHEDPFQNSIVSEGI